MGLYANPMYAYCFKWWLNGALGMVDQKGNGLAEFLAENAERILLAVLAVAALAIFIVAGAYVVHFWGVPLAEKGDVWGQFGDYLGGVLNPVFGFLSVFALLVALVLQTRELKLSRESLKLSQEELRLSREEQAKAAEALALQNKAIQKQSFEQTFFAWLGTYREILGEVQNGEGHGREALKHMWQRELSGEFISGWDSITFSGNSMIPEALVGFGIDSLKAARREHYPVISKAAGETWGMLYKTFEIQLDSFYRVLYRLLKWIDEQPSELLSCTDKWLYVGIVRSQLSWIEMVFLFYNGMSARGTKFKDLINRYALFDNLTIDSDLLLLILKECPMDSVGYAPTAFNSDEARRAT